MNKDEIMNTYKYFIGVSFAGASKAYYFGTDDDTLVIGDKVVVETVSGLELGEISVALKPTSAYKSGLELKPIIRRPTSLDLEDYEMSKKEADIALKITQKEVTKLDLPMRLLSAQYTLDGAKVTITYTADNRVDFRELLHVLAPQLKCRIELHQLAPRDKAKMVGGIGTCGLPLCCSTFLNQFDGIAISKAKNQMLTLNIPKLSGQCGKLICCLNYEDDLYTEARKNFPRPGTPVKYNGTDYVVDSFNIISQTIKLKTELDVAYLSLDEYNELTRNAHQGKHDRRNDKPRA